MKRWAPTCTFHHFPQKNTLMWNEKNDQQPSSKQFSCWCDKNYYDMDFFLHFWPNPSLRLSKAKELIQFETAGLFLGWSVSSQTERTGARTDALSACWQPACWHSLQTLRRGWHPWRAGFHFAELASTRRVISRVMCFEGGRGKHDAHYSRNRPHLSWTCHHVRDVIHSAKLLWGPFNEARRLSGPLMRQRRNRAQSQIMIMIEGFVWTKLEITRNFKPLSLPWLMQKSFCVLKNSSFCLVTFNKSNANVTFFLTNEKVTTVELKGLIWTWVEQPRLIDSQKSAL